MTSLIVRVVENGFLVKEESEIVKTKLYVFETPASLSKYIEKWGNESVDKKVGAK